MRKRIKYIRLFIALLAIYPGVFYAAAFGFLGGIYGITFLCCFISWAWFLFDTIKQFKTNAYTLHGYTFAIIKVPKRRNKGK